MRLTSSTHNHTNLCDGRNTPDEMARAALEAGDVYKRQALSLKADFILETE